MYDVKQEQYMTVIREMIRHENDITNHCIMWLMIGQGLSPTHLSLQNIGAHSRIAGASVAYAETSIYGGYHHEPAPKRDTT
jgi:hypothetical protein